MEKVQTPIIMETMKKSPISRVLPDLSIEKLSSKIFVLLFTS
jgi:hypothetical protein